MSEDNNNLSDAISSLQAAFSEGASAEAMKKGERVLGAMLSALRGAIGARETPPTASTPEYASASSAASAPSTAAPTAKKAPKPDMLEFVVGFLKSKLDDDDRATIEAQAPPFSVPFISM